MKKALLFIVLSGSLTVPAFAQDVPPLLVEAPCGWFTKVTIDRDFSAGSAIPYAWVSTHVVRLDTWAAVTGQIVVTPGLYRVDDGTDAFEFIERKCGQGVVPDGTYRTAMPLPFGLLPWYKD